MLFRSVLRTFDSIAGRASYMAGDLYAFRPIRSLDDILRDIDAVTLDGVRRTWEEIMAFPPVRVSVGPKPVFA